MTPRRRTTLALAALCASLAALAFAAAPASAREYDSQITGFSNLPWAIAFDGADNAWISTSCCGGYISEFNAYPSQTLLGTVNGGGIFGLSGNYLHSIGIDNSTGYLYVADSGPVVVDIFDNTGAFSQQVAHGFGGGYDYVAVDNSGGPTQGRFYVASTNRLVQAFDAGGNPVNFSASASYISGNAILGTPSGPSTYTPFGSSSPWNVATDSAGDIYVVDKGNRVVDEFDSTGAFVQAFTGAGAPAPFSGGVNGRGGLTGVAVDPTNGDVLIVDGGNGNGNASDGVVDEFDSSGAYVGQITGWGPSESTPFGTLVGGIAVNSNGYVYVTNVSNISLAVDIFTPQVILPKVTYGAVSNLTKTSGTLNASIDLHGGPDVTSCHFEYGTDTSYGSGSLPCLDSGNATVGTPGNPITVTTGVHAALSGLTGGTTYHYRVDLVTANGTKQASDQTFTTPAAVDGLSTDPATNLAPASATLNGSFAGSGDNTTYYFEWGTTTSYGMPAPVYAAGSPPGPGRTSLFLDLTGLSPATTYHYRIVATNKFGTSYGQDRQLTTATAIDSLSTDPPTNPVAGSETLNGSYTGHGKDTTYYFEYVNDADYNPNHPDPYSAGQTTAAPPGADAGPGTGAQHVSAVVSLPVNTIYHYRVVATNLFGTNYGQDQVFLSAPPNLPAIDATSSSNVAQSGATLDAQINPGFGDTVYRFRYGTDTSYGSSTPISDSIGSDNTDHAVSTGLAGLTPGTTYHYQAVAINFGGTTHGPDRTFSTPAAPLVESSSASAITQTSATLGAQLRAGFSPTTYHFEYGTTAGYGSRTPESAPIGSDNSVHAVGGAIAGLSPATTYHYRVVATNAVGAANGSDQTFTTVALTPVVVVPPPTTCRKGFVKRHGACVKKKTHRKRKHHKRSASHG